MSMFITIKHQPQTKWPPIIPRINCQQLKAYLTPGQCKLNQETARHVKEEFRRRGTIITLRSRNHKDTGFSMSELTRFRACALCSICRQVMESDLDAAIKSCAEAVKWFESIPLDTVSPEVRERVKKARNRRRYEKRKDRGKGCGKM